jgi:hypothetical protein
MMLPMNRRALLLCVMTLFIAAAPVRAQDDEEQLPDARVEGYVLSDGKVGSGQLDPKDARSNATVWFILSGVGVIGLGVMFKNAKRTHLD